MPTTTPTAARWLSPQTPRRRSPDSDTPGSTPTPPATSTSAPATTTPPPHSSSPATPSKPPPTTPRARLAADPQRLLRRLRRHDHLRRNPRDSQGHQLRGLGRDRRHGK